MYDYDDDYRNESFIIVAIKILFFAVGFVFLAWRFLVPAIFRAGRAIFRFLWNKMRVTFFVLVFSVVLSIVLIALQSVGEGNGTAVASTSVPIWKKALAYILAPQAVNTVFQTAMNWFNTLMVSSSPIVFCGLVVLLLACLPLVFVFSLMIFPILLYKVIIAAVVVDIILLVVRGRNGIGSAVNA